MRVCYQFVLIAIILLLNSAFQPLFAQLGFDLQVDKPEPYDNRTLRSEKTPAKPIKGTKKFFQNLTTHYNYFFNANNKINEIIDGAKQSFKDDYAELLAFYNYELDVTSRDTVQLDSVIYKSRTAIVMHDLRNEWADNMYLLWGAAWFLQKKFDSAALMFQFINYAFAEKEPDGYYKFIGSRLDGNNALSISTDESKKSMSGLSSRNNAFIWQIRTSIESGRFSEAATLIAVLKADPFFPKRLNKDLEEVQAYWFYKQNIWDSSAIHLSNALDNARTKQERARWEYLIAQMFEKTGHFESAKEYYTKAIGHTTDPVMDVFSRLNTVRVTKDTSGNYIDKNVAELLKMAKRDKYTDYRDVIYYMAAQMEIERNNLPAAQELLLKASKYNSGNLASRSKSFLMIADLAYDQKKYLQAAAFYDSASIGINNQELKNEEIQRVLERKAFLSKIVGYTSTIAKQDSLQRIAAMPEEERTAYINKLLKRLLKEMGLSDQTITSGSLPNNNASDLFASSSKGEWYFYNASSKTQGAAQFKQVWGNRPNADNWRRFSVVSQQLATRNPVNTQGNQANNTTAAVASTPSFDNLVKNLPLTPEQLKLSNDSISNALFGLGTVLLNEAEDYLSAIDALEKLRSHYPSYPNMSEVLFNLYYAYKKAGNEVEANRIKQLLLAQYPSSKFAGILSTGKDVTTNSKSEEATKTYNDIYNLFIEGRFNEAVKAKKEADSIYKTNYWQPQLLYIESVYHIRQREDSVAKNILQTLIGQDPNAPMAKKAQTMIDVLSRRTQIEEELSRYQIQRVEDSTTNKPLQTVVQIPPVKKDTVLAKPIVQNPPLKDSVVSKPIVQNPPVKKDTVAEKPVVLTPVKKDTLATTKPVSVPPVKKDSVIKKQDVVSTKPVRRDTVAKKIEPPVTTNVNPTVKQSVVVAKPIVNTSPKPQRKPGEYYFDSTVKHHAAIILDKVDPLFVTEVRNAYTRFNRERYRQTFPMNVVDMDATRKILLIGDFASAQEALNYMQMAKQAAAGEVMPWLKADKYSFSIISDENLPLLQEKKDLEQYRKFLVQNLPNKF